MLQNRHVNCKNDLISAIDRPTGNEPFTYKNRSFVGPSCQKLSNFLEQQNIDVDEDTNDYYQITIHFVRINETKYLYLM